MSLGFLNQIQPFNSVTLKQIVQMDQMDLKHKVENFFL